MDDQVIIEIQVQMREQQRLSKGGSRFEKVERPGRVSRQGGFHLVIPCGIAAIRSSSQAQGESLRLLAKVTVPQIK